MLQRYYPKVFTSIRVTFFALGLSIASSLLWTDWSSWSHDPCQDFTCSYSLNSSIVCPSNHTIEACQSFSPSCVWMQNGTFGPCHNCPPVCRNPGKHKDISSYHQNSHPQEQSLSVYQLYIGNMLLAIGFTMGRAASSGYYSELLQGKAQGFLMGLIIATGMICSRF